METSDETEVGLFTGLLRDQAASKTRRAARGKNEQLSQMTDKQLKARRGGNATRTAQMAFRCSPEFKALVDRVRRKGTPDEESVADVMEAALKHLGNERGIR